MNDTWKLWVQFLFNDCYCYDSLYLTIRESNWDMHMSSLKLVAPLFGVFDHTTYQRIISHHLADIQKYPRSILTCLKFSRFTVNITRQKWHAVALDEAHDMCINKDPKAAVVHPTDAYMQNTTLFHNDRIKIYKNLEEQLFPEKGKVATQTNTIADTTPLAKQQEENIIQMWTAINTNKLFELPLTINSRGILNVFTGQKATTEQASDMFFCLQIGNQSFETYVKYYILKQPSTVYAPV